MLIESLVQKTRLAMMTVFAVIGGCTVICAFTVWCCISLVNEERQQIYVLDGDIPFLAERARLEANFTMEAKAHIQLFHQYFFNLPPDNDYIKWTVGKAMYMADFPHKFEVVSDKLLSLWGIRFTIVMNYLAFYTVDDAMQTMHIVRFLYGKSNWITILKTDAANGSLPVFS